MYIRILRYWWEMMLILMETRMLSLKHIVLLLPSWQKLFVVAIRRHQVFYILHCLLGLEMCMTQIPLILILHIILCKIH